MASSREPIHNTLVGDAHRDAYLTNNDIARCAHDSDPEAFERELSRYRHLLPDRRPLRVLDLGCGTGAWSLQWRGQQADVTGVDFDPEFVRLALRRPGLEGGFHGLVADATALPLPDQHFDLVESQSLLEHVPDWRGVVREAVRVLRPGGVLIMHTTNRLHPFQNEVNHFPFYPWIPDGLKKPILGWIMEHRRDLVNYTLFPAVHWFNPKKLRAEFERHGLVAYDRLDLMRPEMISGHPLKRAIGRLVVPSDGHGPRGKLLYYLATRTTSLYAKRPER